MSKIPLIAALLFPFLLSACQENGTAANSTDSAQAPIAQTDSTNQPSDTPEQPETTTQNEEVSQEEMGEYAFNPHKTAKTAEDFIPNPDFFEIQHKADGDLNLDGLPDMAIVIKYKDDIDMNQRYFLVALQDNTGIYHLDKVSGHIFEPEHAEDEYPSYVEEEIEINNGILKTSFYGYGPSGTIIAQFIYQDKELVLSRLETSSSGAGGNEEYYYDFIKGEIEIHATNTMLEDMPTTIEKTPLAKKSYPFESVNFDQIIEDSWHQND